MCGRLIEVVSNEAGRVGNPGVGQCEVRVDCHGLLEEVEGLGKRRKQALIRYFGSVEAIGEASEEEIAALPGIPAKLAARIKTHLRKVFAEDF